MMNTISGWDELNILKADNCKVVLNPITKVDLDSLWKISQDPNLWQYASRKLYTYEAFKFFIDESVELQTNNQEKVYAICLLNGEVVGSTRIKKISKEHRRVEIGNTWVTPSWQRTYVNTHAKYLLLTHALEVMQCIRVEWKTDINNHKSRDAMLRLGAKQDGIFRNHMILPDGSLRDSVYYSIISDEWHDTKKQLQIKL